MAEAGSVDVAAHFDILDATANKYQPKVQCKLCKHVFSGGKTRQLGHLLGDTKSGAKGCTSVPPDLAKQLKAHAATCAQAKEAKEQKRKRIDEVEAAVAEDDTGADGAAGPSSRPARSRPMRRRSPVRR